MHVGFVQVCETEYYVFAFEGYEGLIGRDGKMYILDGGSVPNGGRKRGVWNTEKCCKYRPRSPLYERVRCYFWRLRQSHSGQSAPNLQQHE
jgi:hypothetical protein